MLKNEKIKFILASASPRRKELVGHLQIPFEIITSNIDEVSQELAPDKFAVDIASQKGMAVFNSLKDSENIFLVSSDTVVSLDGLIYGKPKNRDEAGVFLSQLAGKTHSVFTGVFMCLSIEGRVFQTSFVEETRVTFNNINDELMRRYLATGDSLDKAGAYGIQGPSLTFISKVEGDYANVVGFPLSRFVAETQSFFDKHFEKKEMWLKYF